MHVMQVNLCIIISFKICSWIMAILDYLGFVSLTQYPECRRNYMTSKTEKVLHDIYE